jgi:dihydroorotase
MLNIVGRGMGGGAIEQNVEDMDAKAAAALARKNRDTVVGIKTAHFSGPQWTAVERAVQAGMLADIPVMVDFGDFRPERPFQELVLKKLRPGDIYTHMYLGAVPLFDKNGRLMPYLMEARKRGVIFDVGHGGGSFLFSQAVPAVNQGFVPDSISTDLHINSMNTGMKDILNVMSKFLTMGLTLQDVIAKTTWQPAQEIRRNDLGNLSIGSPADIAVLRVDEGSFGFVDVFGARMKGSKKLVCELTVRSGRVVYDLNGITREEWDKLGNYKAQGDAVWDDSLGAGVRTQK